CAPRVGNFAKPRPPPRETGMLAGVNLNYYKRLFAFGFGTKRGFTMTLFSKHYIVQLLEQ
ncbi:MAG: hypothetical protein LBD76_01685, partial [Prevotellaceae bacterium]|nr:hypothetical protein [Prevotellaceae bacterium]